MNDDLKELYKHISEKIERETKDSSWSIFNNVTSALGAIGIAIIGFFTYSHDRQLSDIDSAFSASKLIGDLVNSLTEDSLKRDIAVLAVSHSLTSQYNNSNINNAHLANAYLAYEITERIALKTISEHIQKLEKYNYLNSTDTNTNDNKLFDLASHQIDLIDDLNIVLEKNRKIGKTLDGYVKNSKTNKKLVLAFNQNLSGLFQEEDFIKRSQLLADKSAEIYSEFIVFSDYNSSDNQNNSNSLNIENIKKENGLTTREINRINFASREIMSNAANNKNTIFTIFDSRVFYYRHNNKIPTIFDIEKYLEESLVDKNNWYISETYKPVNIQNTGCKSSIRYFHNSDRNAAEQLKQKLQSTENKFSELIENTFETVNLTKWAKRNGIDVKKKQLEVWLMSEQKCQVN